MTVRNKRRRGQLLVELAVAVAIAIAGVAASLARAQSSAKTGREIELMNQLMQDATTFVGYATNLHKMGGPNFVANTSTTGQVAFEYGSFLQRNYPINNVTIVTVGATNIFSGFIYLNAGLGTQSAIGANGTPAPGAQLFYVEGSDNFTPTAALGNQNICQVVYFLVQTAPLAVQTGVGGVGPPDFAYTAAATFPPVSALGANQNGSTITEGVGTTVAEDPNTGIVAIVTPFMYGSVDLSVAGGTPPVPGAPNAFFPFFPDPGSQSINVFPQPNNF